MKRLLLLLIAVGIALYLVKTQGLFVTKAAPADPRGTPIDRARSAAAASDARTSGGESTSREADASSNGGVTENMTPDQVRALLGAPDEVSSDTTGSGGSRETWTYRAVGKTVVFENGIAVSIR